MNAKLGLRLLFLALLSLSGFAHGQGTTIGYQGRLNDGGLPATGLYDITFNVFDVEAAGAALAGPLVLGAVPVTNGLFNVSLDFGPDIFTGPARWLEIGVRTDGFGAFTSLIPRQQITAAPYAITAGAVTGPINGSSIVNGSITSAQLASGTVTAANIASNSITTGQLASGAAAANLNAAGQSGVASGGIILSSNGRSAELQNAGYVKIGSTTMSDAWLERVNGTPSARYHHTAVWTGTEMIVWGGENNQGNSFNDGGRYDPAGNNWTAVSTSGAPVGRSSHTAVWTGSEMIVWGGWNFLLYDHLNTGGRYNPAGDSWLEVSTNGAPASRLAHTAVWTGSEMIVWGGAGATLLIDGGRYNPADNSWTAVTASGSPNSRRGHTAVWTGSKMIVWGGYKGTPLNDGGRYNPADNTWTAVNFTSAPAGRSEHTAVWTGTEMIVWGGSGTRYFNDGGRYNPAGDNWTAMTTNGAPAARDSHTAVWTGSEMIVWGGSEATNYNDGGRFNPADNSWTAVTTNGAPAGRSSHLAVWTGSEMIVWGGYGGTNFFNDTFSYTPGRVLYLYQRP